MRIVYLITLGILLSACSSEPSSILDQIKENGELIVVTRNSPTTYYMGSNGPAGFEYDLAKAFADHLGVKLKIIVPTSFSEVIPMVQRGEAHIAAAGLTVTDERIQQIRFGPIYQTITQQLVYRLNNKPPQNVNDLT